MSQFDNYDNIPLEYVPDNTTPMVPIKKTTIDISSPKKEYNIWGKEIGIQITYGDTTQIPISIKGSIKVSEDAVILPGAGEVPSNTQDVPLGTYAYNVTDIKCWKLVEMLNTKVWEPTPFTYFNNGTKMITLNPNMDGRKLVAVIYNSRYNEVARQEWVDVNEAQFIIDKDFFEKMYPGTYTLCVRIEDEDVVSTITTTQLHITQKDLVQVSVCDTNKLMPKESDKE